MDLKYMTPEGVVIALRDKMGVICLPFEASQPGEAGLMFQCLN